MELHLTQAEVLNMIGHGVTNYLHLGGGKDIELSVTLRVEGSEDRPKKMVFSADVVWEYPKE